MSPQSLLCCSWKNSYCFLNTFFCLLWVRLNLPDVYLRMLWTLSWIIFTHIKERNAEVAGAASNFMRRTLCAFTFHSCLCATKIFRQQGWCILKISKEALFFYLSKCARMRLFIWISEIGSQDMHSLAVVQGRNHEPTHLCQLCVLEEC